MLNTNLPDTVCLQGISFETGALEMGRDHYSGALLTAVLSRLQRHHVGYWLFDAARKPEAAYLFECQPVLKSWLMQLAEQRHGKGRCVQAVSYH